MPNDTFAPSTVLGGSGDVLPVGFGDDSALAVTFYMREVEDEEQTRIQGRVIKKAVPFCRKEAPGDSRTVWDQPASDIDKRRWPTLWAAFERGETEIIMGTPLESWPLLTADHRVALHNMNFKTVEQIAGVTDSAINDMRSGNGPLLQNLREHAIKWLEEQEAGAMERRLGQDLAEERNRREALEDRYRALAQEMERMKAAQLAGAQVDVPVEPQPAPEPIPDVQSLENIPTVEDLPPKKRRGRPPKDAA